MIYFTGGSGIVKYGNFCGSNPLRLIYTVEDDKIMDNIINKTLEKGQKFTKKRGLWNKGINLYNVTRYGKDWIPDYVHEEYPYTMLLREFTRSDGRLWFILVTTLNL